MSRARLSYVLAAFGILITTGGCSSSATAPEAATVEVSANRFSNPTQRDSAAEPTSSGDGDATVSGGVIMIGGGRSDN